MTDTCTVVDVDRENARAARRDAPDYNDRPTLADVAEDECGDLCTGEVHLTGRTERDTGASIEAGPCPRWRETQAS